MRLRPTDVAFGGGLVAASLLYGLLVLKPLLHESGQIKARLATTERNIEQGLDFTEGLEDVRLYITEFEESLAELDKLVPQQFDSDRRIQLITTVIKECGLRDDSIRPDPSQPRGAVVAHPLTVKVVGGYPQLVDFLHRAESLPQFTRVTRLVVQQDNASTGVLAEVELTSYSVGDEA